MRGTCLHLGHHTHCFGWKHENNFGIDVAAAGIACRIPRSNRY